MTYQATRKIVNLDYLCGQISQAVALRALLGGMRMAASVNGGCVLVPIRPPRTVIHTGTIPSNIHDRPIVEVLDDVVAQDPERVTVVAHEGSWTLRQTWNHALALAHRIRAAIVDPETTVVVASNDTRTHTAAALACFRLGVPFIPLTLGTTALAHVT